MKATLDAIDHSDYELDLVGGQMTSSVTRQPSLAARWLYIAGCKHTNRKRPRPNLAEGVHLSWSTRPGSQAGFARDAQPSKARPRTGDPHVGNVFRPLDFAAFSRETAAGSRIGHARVAAMLRRRYALLRETRNPGAAPNPREGLYKKRPTLTGITQVLRNRGLAGLTP
jgi:hypothetical protein